MSREKLSVRDLNAHRFADWLATRGGLLVWSSKELDHPGSITTPFLHRDGSPVGSPHWRYGATPERHITDPAEVEVTTDEVVEQFPVVLKQHGMKIVLNAKSSARVRTAVDRAGPEAFYEFGAGKNNAARTIHGLQYGDDTCTIYRSAKTVPLPEWLVANPVPEVKPSL